MTYQEDIDPTAEKKPEFFYGYVVVAASLVVMTLTFGINYTFGVFFGPLIDDFGWTRATTSAAYSVSTLVAGFWGIFAGKISDRFGPKLLSIAGGICLGAGFLLMSQVDALWQVYLIYGVIIALGIGGCWPILLQTAAKWFVARRGLVTGIIAAGIGLGTVLTPPLATWFISAYDWRSAYAIVGTGTMVLIIAASFFLKRDPYQIGKLPYGQTETEQSDYFKEPNFRRVFLTKEFWMAGGVYLCFGYCLHSIMVHIVPHATGLGISPVTASGILASIGISSIAAKLLAGIAGDRLGIRRTVIISLTLLVLSFLWVQFADELWGFYLFGIGFGVAYGGVMTMQSLLLAELFGLGSLGVILGSVTFLYTVGAAIGPLVAGKIFDMSGTYRPAFIVCTLLAAAAIILTVSIRPSVTSFKSQA